MYIDSSTIFLGSFDESDDFIEATFDVLSYVIFQVEGKVLNAFLEMVVATVVSCTVNDVGDAILL